MTKVLTKKAQDPYGDVFEVLRMVNPLAAHWIKAQEEDPLRGTDKGEALSEFEQWWNNFKDEAMKEGKLTLSQATVAVRDKLQELEEKYPELKRAIGSIMGKLEKIANWLEEEGFIKEADVIDKLFKL